MPGSGISSEPSAHQIAQSSSSSSVRVHPSIPDSLVLYWTLVDQAVIPPGFEDAFLGFSEAWTEAAARDDHRKSLWNNESAAVSLAAQKKAQEEKVRLDVAGDNHLEAGGAEHRFALMTFFIICSIVGVPLSWNKTSGGETVTWVGFELLHRTRQLGISQRRADWFRRPGPSHVRRGGTGVR